MTSAEDDAAVRVTGSIADDPWTDAPGGTVERPLADRTGGRRR